MIVDVRTYTMVPGRLGAWLALYEAEGMPILARILGWHTVGVAPEHMGIGPAPAIAELLKKLGLPLDRVDLIEVNEAFAAQYLAVEKELKLDRERVNVNGGAIGLGHPLGASGARITFTLALEMKRRKARYGMVTMCVGGGMGAAGIFENLQ